MSRRNVGRCLCSQWHFDAIERADEALKRAVSNGAKELRPVKDQFYGDRSGRSLRTFVILNFEPRSIGRIDRKTTIIVGSAVIPPNAATFSQRLFRGINF